MFFAIKNTESLIFIKPLYLLTKQNGNVIVNLLKKDDERDSTFLMKSFSNKAICLF